MAKASRLAGATSNVFLIFIQDTTKTDGSGLTGLTNSTCGTMYYKRSNGSASVQVSTINTISTLGTFAGTSTQGAFKEVDATNMPGVYELHPPDNALASGAKNVVVMLKGGTNAAPSVIEIELTVVDNQAFDFGMLDTAAGVETSLTLRQYFRLAAAVLFGKSNGLDTTTAKYRDFGDTKDRINATVDVYGNRSAVTRDSS